MGDYNSLSNKIQSLKSDPITGCLFWRWWTDPEGRARFNLRGKKIFVARYLKAQRYEMDYDDHEWICKRLCDNADCINIDHFVITKK